MPIRSLPVAALLALAVAVLPSAPGAPAEKTDLPEPFPHPKGYVCYRAAPPVVIDGDLKDKAWEVAPWTDAFVDIEGDKKPEPRFRTRAKMLWDDEALYIAAELEEPHLWGTLREHDSVIFRDNDFEVFLDPDGDNHLYGELELNALNTTWDLLLTKPYKDGGHAVNAWEITGLKTAVKLNGTLNDPRDTDKGWTIEIRWPWKGLTELVSDKAVPLPPKDGDRWRINFSRVEWDTEVADGKYKKTGPTEHNWVWSPQGVIDMHRPERWGYLQFSTAKPGTAALKPDADWDVRDTLHRAYYAQKSHFKTHGKYATAAGDLGLKLPPGRLSIGATRNTFEMTWTEDGKPLYTITQDARVRKE
ncbi:MAG: carbohydrate-binding family 9-like protein [Planctomycetes bacterium]|nr:carbohydrate-binding family 9-like protein [Planctomycetota bacterium]